MIVSVGDALNIQKLPPGIVLHSLIKKFEKYLADTVKYKFLTAPNLPYFRILFASQ